MTQAKQRSKKSAGSRANEEASQVGAAQTVSPLPVLPSEKPPAPTRPTKAARLHGMLASPDGATLAQLCEATGWQSHTVRAALTRLRQAGHAVERSKAAAGQTVYRVRPAGEAAEVPLVSSGQETGPDHPGHPEPQGDDGGAA